MNIAYAGGIVPRPVVKNWDGQCVSALRELPLQQILVMQDIKICVG